MSAKDNTSKTTSKENQSRDEFCDTIIRLVEAYRNQSGSEANSTDRTKVEDDASGDLDEASNVPWTKIKRRRLDEAEF